MGFTGMAINPAAGTTVTNILNADLKDPTKISQGSSNLYALYDVLKNTLEGGIGYDKDGAAALENIIGKAFTTKDFTPIFSALGDGVLNGQDMMYAGGSSGGVYGGGFFSSTPMPQQNSNVWGSSAYNTGNQFTNPSNQFSMGQANTFGLDQSANMFLNNNNIPPIARNGFSSVLNAYGGPGNPYAVLQAKAAAFNDIANNNVWDTV